MDLRDHASLKACQLGALALLFCAVTGYAQTPSPEQAAFFEKTIRSLLVNECSGCHSGESVASGNLSVDSRESLLKGGKSGPAIVPGKPGASLLIQRVLATDTQQRMPKGAPDPLSGTQIAALKTWIEGGAYWPEKKEDSASSSTTPLAPRPPSATPVKANTLYPRPATPEQLAFFKEKVRPIFVNNCYNCHSDAFKEAGGLRVDVGISIFAGGKDGPVIIPGKPEKSLLIQRVKATDPHKRMPQESKEPLPPEEIATLEKWIKDGAAWPDETEKLPPTPPRLVSRYRDLRARHWAWQPLTDPEAPPVQDRSWAASGVDRFVLAKLEQNGLTPVADASPVTLIRRVTYDLTGLPPSPAAVRAFEKDHSGKAYRELVDRLLASPQFGERWGRHWLDVARYAESSGPSRNMPYPNAWRYRDYVIDAVNRDVPFNRFVQEQLAGDLLPAATPEEHDRLLIATGFLALGPKDVNQRFKARFKMDNVDDQIDTVTRSTLALTVSCARCHDHKFDPIPTTDYYALASIFTSTDDAAGLGSGMGGSSLSYYEPKLLSYLSTAAQAAPVPKEKVEELKRETEEAKKALDAIKPDATGAPLTREQRRKKADLRSRYQLLSEDLKLIEDLGERGYAIHSAREGTITDTTVRIRGVEERHGPVVPRGFLSVVNVPGAPHIPANHSGRLELAQWITDPANPLTARVYVNRVWQHLFGIGIVSSVDNFGSTGDQPSNPELLDYLAQQFIRGEWSTKRLVRSLVLSHAYRLGSDAPSKYRELDPSDRLVWRHAPRRMEAEEIRDSILASSGQLDLTHPHGSPSMALRMIEVRDDGPAVGSILAAADRSRFRSVYLPLLRDETPRELAPFDPVSQTLVTGRREETTVPSQALFMLNSPFVRSQSLQLARALLRNSNLADTSRIRQTYERVLGRAPQPADIHAVQTFLAKYRSTWVSAHPDWHTAKPVRLSRAVDNSTSDLTAGIVRSDGLTQDDEIEETKSPNTDWNADPDNPSLAAWSAFIQALYGSAEFQFVR